jgi:hypothetical protein
MLQKSPRLTGLTRLCRPWGGFSRRFAVTEQQTAATKAAPTAAPRRDPVGGQRKILRLTADPTKTNDAGNQKGRRIHSSGAP